MKQRLTKQAIACKTIIVLLVLSHATSVRTALAADRDILRDCVADAPDIRSISACEQQQQERLLEQIEADGRQIQEKLGKRERALFDQNVAAWENWLNSEQRMLELTFSARSDRLGAALLPGALTQRYEQRASQLREHLRNLKQAK